MGNRAVARRRDVRDDVVGGLSDRGEVGGRVTDRGDRDDARVARGDELRGERGGRGVRHGDVVGFAERGGGHRRSAETGGRVGDAVSDDLGERSDGDGLRGRDRAGYRDGAGGTLDGGDGVGLDRRGGAADSVRHEVRGVIGDRVADRAGVGGGLDGDGLGDRGGAGGHRQVARGIDTGGVRRIGKVVGCVGHVVGGRAHRAEDRDRIGLRGGGRGGSAGAAREADEGRIGTREIRRGVRDEVVTRGLADGTVDLGGHSDAEVGLAGIGDRHTRADATRGTEHHGGRGGGDVRGGVGDRVADDGATMEDRGLRGIDDGGAADRRARRVRSEDSRGRVGEVRRGVSDVVGDRAGDLAEERVGLGDGDGAGDGDGRCVGDERGDSGGGAVEGGVGSRGDRVDRRLERREGVHCRDVRRDIDAAADVEARRRALDGVRGAGEGGKAVGDGDRAGAGAGEIAIGGADVGDAVAQRDRRGASEGGEERSAAALEDGDVVADRVDLVELRLCEEGVGHGDGRCAGARGEAGGSVHDRRVAQRGQVEGGVTQRVDDIGAEDCGGTADLEARDDRRGLGDRSVARDIHLRGVVNDGVGAHGDGHEVRSRVRERVACGDGGETADRAEELGVQVADLGDGRDVGDDDGGGGVEDRELGRDIGTGRQVGDGVGDGVGGEKPEVGGAERGAQGDDVGEGSRAAPGVNERTAAAGACNFGDGTGRQRRQFGGRAHNGEGRVDELCAAELRREAVELAGGEGEVVAADGGRAIDEDGRSAEEGDRGVGEGVLVCAGVAEGLDGVGLGDIERAGDGNGTGGIRLGGVADEIGVLLFERVARVHLGQAARGGEQRGVDGLECRNIGHLVSDREAGGCIERGQFVADAGGSRDVGEGVADRVGGRRGDRNGQGACPDGGGFLGGGGGRGGDAGRIAQAGRLRGQHFGRIGDAVDEAGGRTDERGRVEQRVDRGGLARICGGGRGDLGGLVEDRLGAEGEVRGGVADGVGDHRADREGFFGLRNGQRAGDRGRETLDRSAGGEEISEGVGEDDRGRAGLGAEGLEAGNGCVDRQRVAGGSREAGDAGDLVGGELQRNIARAADGVDAQRAKRVQGQRAEVDGAARGGLDGERVAARLAGDGREACRDVSGQVAADDRQGCSVQHHVVGADEIPRRGDVAAAGDDDRVHAGAEANLVARPEVA